ncbi:MAG TPA: menaquinone biosynthesis protein [Ferruginibacter sp.]|nr:menaquinone biosynthesis protein [Ferruginibacter sp.]
MAQKIRVGAVSYLNSKPLIHGFEQGRMKDEIDLIIDYPANIAAMLVDDRIDVGLVPVAVIPSLPEHYIISDYCIGCDGEVASVCLFSEVPMEQVETVLLDYQSRTSVALLKVLLKEHWKISPQLVAAGIDYEKDISGATAGLVIGDRALQQRSRSAYIYDLGLAWKEMTGLPFVFAAWISNKKIDPAFIGRFNEANAAGFDNLPLVIDENKTPVYDLLKYYTENIRYRYSGDQQKALQRFMQEIRSIS